MAYRLITINSWKWDYTFVKIWKMVLYISIIYYNYIFQIKNVQNMKYSNDLYMKFVMLIFSLQLDTSKQSNTINYH